MKDAREGSRNLPAASPAQPARCVQDIPELAASAAESHPGVGYLVAAPIGLHAAVAVSRLMTCFSAERGGGMWYTHDDEQLKEKILRLAEL